MLPGGFDEAEVVGIRRADDNTASGVGDPPIDGYREVHAEQIAVSQAVIEWKPMQHSIIDGQADRVSKRTLAERRRVVPVAGDRATLFDPTPYVQFQIEKIDPDLRTSGQLVQHTCDEATRDTHLVDLTAGLQFEHAFSVRADCYLP